MPKPITIEIDQHNKAHVTVTHKGRVVSTIKAESVDTFTDLVTTVLEELADQVVNGDTDPNVP